MYKAEIDKIIVDKSDLDVAATIECGQFFCFFLTQNGYKVKSGAHVCDVYELDDVTVIETDAVDYFVDFFSLDRDIVRIKRTLSRYPELNKALEKCGSLRILHQPLFETIVSFIISANNNIPRIKTIINRMCALFGDVFPTPDKLAALSERELNAIGCGYRSPYILKSSIICRDTDILKRLPAADTKTAQKLLIELPGVGQKIADCVALFALGRNEVFPVDTWMLKTQRRGSETETQVRERLMSAYGEYAGYAQQFLYYYSAILKEA